MEEDLKLSDDEALVALRAVFWLRMPAPRPPGRPGWRERQAQRANDAAAAAARRHGSARAALAAAVAPETGR
jgi:hypothetical protein